MTPIYDTNGNITAYYDSNLLFYDVNQNPITDASGQQLMYDPTTNSAIDPATAYAGGDVGATPTVVSYQGNTPPATSTANAILKTLTGQTYQYNAQGTNPVLYTGSLTGTSSMSTYLIYGAIGLIAYSLLGSKSSGGSAPRRRRSKARR